jgi:hypothetical protein
VIKNLNQSLIFEKLKFFADGFNFYFDSSGFYADSDCGAKYVFSGADLQGFSSAILIEGPRVAIGTDGTPDCRARMEPVKVNPHVKSQEQMREIFRCNERKYGIRSLMAPEMGGIQPRTYSTAVGVVNS